MHFVSNTSQVMCKKCCILYFSTCNGLYKKFASSQIRLNVLITALRLAEFLVTAWVLVIVWKLLLRSNRSALHISFTTCIGDTDWLDLIGVEKDEL